MVGSILRSWTGRIVIIIVLGSVGYSLLKIQSGPRAIRPVAGQVIDPILLPVIENYADEVDANRGDPKIRMHLGMTYEAATLNTLAEATYLQFVNLFPKRAIGWYRLAVVQERQGNLDDAIFSTGSNQFNAVNVSPVDIFYIGPGCHGHTVSIG